MRQPKMSGSPAQTLEALGDYMQNLSIGTVSQALPTVGDLLGSRVDRVRLWQDDKKSRRLMKEVALPKKKPKARTRHKPNLKRAIDGDLIKILDGVGDPDLSVDLTLDMDSGAVSLAVEMGAALVGQDLSQLVEGAAEADLPTFEDAPFDDEFWSAEEAGAHFGVAKSTITRRIRANDLIGFKLFKNALYVPKEQFAGKTPIKGVSDVLEMFAFEHHQAWSFLTASLFYGDDDARPIDKLRSARTATDLSGCLAEIKAAKEGFDYGDHM